MNTAYHRNAARKAESEGNWADAAFHWDMAIELYPCKGAVAELDKAKMSEKRKAATAMAV